MVPPVIGNAKSVERAQALPLADYIAKYHGGSQKAFADSLGVMPQQVTQWLSKGFVVIDHHLYSPRRALK